MKLLVKNLLFSIHHQIQVIMLHELKADKFRLIIALSTITLGYTHLIAHPRNGRGGTAMLIHPDFTI